MHDEYTDISLARPRRLRKSASRQTSFLARNMQVTDAVFAEMDSTTLRLDEPLAGESGHVDLPCDHLVQQLAGQLQALDQQRTRLARLLNDLKTSHSTAV